MIREIENGDTLNEIDYKLLTVEARTGIVNREYYNTHVSPTSKRCWHIYDLINTLNEKHRANLEVPHYKCSLRHVRSCANNMINYVNKCFN